jgi:hypothetical protein
MEPTATPSQRAAATLAGRLGLNPLCVRPERPMRPSGGFPTLVVRAPVRGVPATWQGYPVEVIGSR